MEGTIREVRIFAGNFVPREWAYCEGQLVPISEYTALYSLLGTASGGDGRVTFGLPDLRGRTPIGVGRGPGLSSYTWGQRPGSEQHYMNVNEMPSHAHLVETSSGAASLSGTATATMKVNSSEAGSNEPSDSYLGKPNAGLEIYIDEATENNLAADAITVDTSGLTVNIAGLSVTVIPTGGSQPFSIMQPSLAMHYVICLKGVFPSRD